MPFGFSRGLVNEDNLHHQYMQYSCIQTQVNNPDNTKTTLATFTGNLGNQWYSSAFEVNANGYEIVFEGTVGGGDEGDIAIDEITMSEGSCGGLSESAPINPTIT